MIHPAVTLSHAAESLLHIVHLLPSAKMRCRSVAMQVQTLSGSSAEPEDTGKMPYDPDLLFELQQEHLDRNCNFYWLDDLAERIGMEVRVAMCDVYAVS